MRSRLVTSAKVIVYINDQPFGRVTGFSWTSATPKRPIYGIDSTEPYELAPTTSQCNGNVSLLRLIDDGGLEGPGIVAQFQSLTREKYFKVLLIERSTDTQIFRADFCSVNSQSWDVPAKGLMTGTFSFAALTWNNEAKITK